VQRKNQIDFMQRSAAAVNAQTIVTHVTIKRASRRVSRQIASFLHNMSRAFEQLFNHAA
jgi:hypothetical protein